MTADERPSGALDVATLGVLGRRAGSHHLGVLFAVLEWIEGRVETLRAG
ncbi:MAG: hypothetical protein ABEH88_07035 [Halobacteriales archaeon]